MINIMNVDLIYNIFYVLGFHLLFKFSFKWLERWRATSAGTGASFSWTRPERFTCTWFSHNTKFSLSACLKPQMMVHVGKDEILVLSNRRSAAPANIGSPVHQNTVWRVKCQMSFYPCTHSCAPTFNSEPWPRVGVLFWTIWSAEALPLEPHVQLCSADGSQIPECQIWLYTSTQTEDKNMICCK